MLRYYIVLKEESWLEMYGMKKKLMFVFGTRPEAIKVAPLLKEIQIKYLSKVEPVIVVTGQHRKMLDQVLDLFVIKPN